MKGMHPMLAPGGPMMQVMGKGMPPMMGKGPGVPPMMGAPRPMGAPPNHQQQHQLQGDGRLNASVLAASPPPVQKQMIGEKLFPAVSKYRPDLAGKITGMMLEMDNSELLMLLESESQLKTKVDEAMRVLESQRA